MGNKSKRRSFIKKLSGTALLTASATPFLIGSDDQTKLINRKDFKSTANDNINLATIGMGIMGFINAETALKIPGVKLVAACDLYDGRLKHTKEVYGNDVFTTRNYKEILNRSDVDAVIISTSDHWHDRISIEAMEAGKAVYCEKPMVHQLGEGLDVVKAQDKNNAIFQVGSQRVSSIVYLKAKELYEAGAIGQLILAEAWYDRRSANGAWQYPIPRDASTKTVDWDRFLGDAPKRDFDATRFFRWRNYQDYGTGVAGDLFVHLFSGLHLILGSMGPSRVYTTGGLRYWKDGRDVPDVMIGCYDYAETASHPAFNLQMRVNFVDGGGGGQTIRLVGTEGVMTIGNTVKIVNNKIEDIPTYGGWDSYNTFDEDNKKAYAEWHGKTYPKQISQTSGGETEYRAPAGYSDHIDHYANFFSAMKSGNKVVEDAAFGFRAAAAALASNQSYFDQKVINWDPVAMKVL